MNQGTSACPHCGHEFELSEALTQQIREHLKTELQADVLKREAEAKRKLDDLKAREEALTKSRASLDAEVEKQLKHKLAEAEARAAKSIGDQFAGKLGELQDALKERDTAIKVFRENELDLRKKQRELEKAKENAELENQRRLDAERSKIRLEAAARFQEQHKLKDLEKDKIINDLKSALEEMKRKAEQGSTQLQGEVLELNFEAELKRFFLHDDIQPVPQGIRGADLIQKVRTSHGGDCGALLWETKNTKYWSARWIPKLKDDMLATRASIAILVSSALPDGIAHFGAMDGVWVSDPVSALPLATVLREQIVALERERQVSVGKNEKMEMLYKYLAGAEFKQKIEGVVEAFTAMQDQINRERRAMEKNWKEREKQLERVIRNTAGMYGDMQGILGAQIANIPVLELDPQELKSLPLPC